MASKKTKETEVNTTTVVEEEVADALEELDIPVTEEIAEALNKEETPIAEEEVPQVSKVAQVKTAEAFTTIVPLYCRETANGTKRKYADLTADQKRNAYVDQDGCAILRPNVTVVAEKSENVNGQVWIKTKYGFIAATGEGGKTYLK